MKNLALSPLALVGILFFCSCKKDNSPAASSVRPKTYTENITSSIVGNSITTYDLSYDGNNRLLSLVSTPAPPELKFVYQYGTSSFTLDLYNFNILSIHEIAWLNTIPFVDSTFQYDDTNDTTTEKYFYNAGKQLVKKNEYSYSKATGGTLTNTTNYTYDNNGNVITETDDFSTTTYDYYSNLLTPFSLDMSYSPVTKNLPKTVTINSGGLIESATHAYKFDSNNRLVADTAAASNGDIVIKTYTY
jgi:YD repeat-containing protein